MDTWKKSIYMALHYPWFQISTGDLGTYLFLWKDQYIKFLALSAETAI
jgi:hypothetical protein